VPVVGELSKTQTPRTQKRRLAGRRAEAAER
jgi:hypothetical protein